MTEHEKNVADMQCWVFRMAQRKWNMSAQECSKLFRKFDIFGFIDECYDILHLNGYNCVVNDIETLLKNRGVAV